MVPAMSRRSSEIGLCVTGSMPMLHSFFFSRVFQWFLMSLSVLPGIFAAIRDHLQYRKKSTMITLERIISLDITSKEWCYWLLDLAATTRPVCDRGMSRIHNNNAWTCSEFGLIWSWMLTPEVKEGKEPAAKWRMQLHNQVFFIRSEATMTNVRAQVVSPP